MNPKKITSEELIKLKQWNWGAFLLPLLWAPANKLYKWTILLFIPFINILVAFYLGFYGNRLAYPKSNFKSIDDFMIIQHYWATWGIRLFIVAIIGFILKIVSN